VRNILLVIKGRSHSILFDVIVEHSILQKAYDMKQWDLDDDALEKLTAIQDYFKEDSLEEREPFGKFFFSQLKKLVFTKKE